MQITQMRRGMGKGFIYPYDSKVEYLESDGQQYIYLGYEIKGDKTGFLLDYSAFPNKHFLFGARYSHAREAFYVANGGSSGTNYTQSFVNYNTTYSTKQWPNNSNRHIMRLEKNIWTIDATQLVAWPAATFTTPPMYLFAERRGDNGVIYYGHQRIYSLKIYEDTTLIMSLFPVRVGAVGYMYDEVGGLLYGNGTLVPLIVGPDLN